MKRILSLLICIILLLSFVSPTIVTVLADELSEESTLSSLDDIIDYYFPDNEAILDNEIDQIIINDPEIIQMLIDSGDLPATQSGTLPESVTITVYPFLPINHLIKPTQSTPISASVAFPQGAVPYIPILSVQIGTRTSSKAAQPFAEDRIGGPSNYSYTYTKSVQTTWTTSMNSSVSVEGEVFTVAEVKAAVSNTVGVSIGSTTTESRTYSISIPEGKIATVRAWVNYFNYPYTANVSTSLYDTTIASGKVKTPAGLVITHYLEDLQPGDL